MRGIKTGDSQAEYKSGVEIRSIGDLLVVTISTRGLPGIEIGF